MTGCSKSPGSRWFTMVQVISVIVLYHKAVGKSLDQRLERERKWVLGMELGNSNRRLMDPVQSRDDSTKRSSNTPLGSDACCRGAIGEGSISNHLL